MFRIFQIIIMNSFEIVRVVYKHLLGILNLLLANGSRRRKIIYLDASRVKAKHVFPHERAVVFGACRLVVIIVRMSIEGNNYSLVLFEPHLQNHGMSIQRVCVRQSCHLHCKISVSMNVTSIPSQMFAVFYFKKEK